MRTKVFIFALAIAQLTACTGSKAPGSTTAADTLAAADAVEAGHTAPSVTFETRKSSQERLFADSLFAIADGREHYLDNLYGTCFTIEAQRDFDGDGITDALVRDVQACGGNAVGDSFFFVTYDGKRGFVITQAFGESVFDEPKILTDDDGLTVVSIVDTDINEYTEEVERTTLQYILADKQAVRYVKPQAVLAMPSISVAEWEALSMRADTVPEEELTPEELRLMEQCTIYEDLYSEKCSWYCGGQVQEVTASACHDKVGGQTYKAQYAHDFDHTHAWASEGSGKGESLTYTFAGACPRVTDVKILNGDARSQKDWEEHARAKTIRMYYRDKLYAILRLDDSRSLQLFPVGILGYHSDKSPDWTLRFEIADTYPAKRHNFVVIPELYFDGIDVH